MTAQSAAKDQSAHQALDKLVQNLDDNKQRWAELDIGKKADLLDQLVARTDAAAQNWVDIAVKGKRMDPASHWVGEEWVSGPWAFVSGCGATAQSLRDLAKGKAPKLPKVSTLRDGRAKAQVFPADNWDALLLNGYRAEVWMQEGVTPSNLSDNMASFYRQKGKPTGVVSLVLGAGNITSIPVLDVVYRLFAMGQVCIVKMNPVNEWMTPVFKEVFAPLIDEGFVAFVQGGIDVGSYLTTHPQVQELHLTGSENTHDAIVFGTGDEGNRRKAADEPLIDKPFTSELGGVGGTLVIPGDNWSAADFRFQAENIVTQKLHNSGHNCIAAQVIVLPENWDGSAKLEAAIKEVLTELPPRVSWYPKSGDRHAQIVARHKDTETFGGDVPRALLCAVPSDAEHFSFVEEFFGVILSITRLPGDDAASFWRNAVDFANNTLHGTLGVNIIVHPSTKKQLGTAFDDGIYDLRYGAVGVNVWNAAAYLLPRCTWGAYPGHARNDIQSGTGVVHNAYLFDKPEKSVVYGPFAPMPRAWLQGEFHSSPKPLWFVTNKTAHLTGERIARFQANPGIGHIPGIFAAALRG